MKHDNVISKGFAFVAMENPVEAQQAVAGLNGHRMDGGSELYVCRAQKKQEREVELKKRAQQHKREMISKNKGKNLYVKPLSLDITDEILRECFKNFGSITSAKVCIF